MSATTEKKIRLKAQIFRFILPGYLQTFKKNRSFFNSMKKILNEVTKNIPCFIALGVIHK
jgi:hypothetical protein